MFGTTRWVLHLAEKTPPHTHTHHLHLLFEEEAKTLEPQQVHWCSIACWVKSGGRTPPGSSVTTNPCCLPSSQPHLTFRLLSFPDGCNQLCFKPFYEDSRLSPPKFLSLLGSMPAWTLNMGSFNKAAPPTSNIIKATVWKICTLVLIWFKVRSQKHSYKSEIVIKTYGLNESSSVGFCIIQRTLHKEFPSSIFLLYLLTLRMFTITEIFFNFLFEYKSELVIGKLRHRA